MNQDQRLPPGGRGGDSASGSFQAPSGGAVDLGLAFQDPLTGAGNRRLLDELLTRRWDGLAAAHGHVALVMADLDAFKAVNDRFGHVAGDEVLITTADLLRSCFRQDDVLVRYGGDEFVVLVPGAGSRTAAALASRARAAVESHRFTFTLHGRSVRLPQSFSLGVASYPEDGLTGAEVFAAADHRLYSEKRRRAAPGRLRRAGLAAFLMLLVLAALVVLERAEIGRRREVVGASVVVATPPPTARELELVGRIRELQAEVVRLRSTRQQATPEPGGAQDDRVSRLEDTIRSLSAQLAAARLQATPVPAAPAATPSSRAPLTVAPSAGGGSGAAVPTPRETPRPPVAQPPAILGYPQPEYPVMARRLRREAAVTIRVRVGSDGKVVGAEVVGARAGYGFDEAALAAVHRARFRPATRDGIPVPGETVLVVRFTRD